LNYKDKFTSALNKSYELDLEVKASPLPFKKSLTVTEQQKILQFCAEALMHYGYVSSSELANQCTPVHLMLQALLKEHLDVDSYITIGDRYWHDYVYCEMSYESIISELNNPQTEHPIKAHVWLTLSDGTVLDCTAEAHADLLFNRGTHPSPQCIMFVKPDEKVDDKSGYHRPYLVGIDFLEKTGVCKLVG
jgi:hypothetical protein